MLRSALSGTPVILAIRILPRINAAPPSTETIKDNPKTLMPPLKDMDRKVNPKSAQDSPRSFRPVHIIRSILTLPTQTTPILLIGSSPTQVLMPEIIRKGGRNTMKNSPMLKNRLDLLFNAERFSICVSIFLIFKFDSNIHVQIIGIDRFQEVGRFFNKHDLTLGRLSTPQSYPQETLRELTGNIQLI